MEVLQGDDIIAEITLRDGRPTVFFATRHPLVFWKSSLRKDLVRWREEFSRIESVPVNFISTGEDHLAGVTVGKLRVTFERSDPPRGFDLDALISALST